MPYITNTMSNVFVTKKSLYTLLISKNGQVRCDYSLFSPVITHTSHTYKYSIKCLSTINHFGPSEDILYMLFYLPIPANNAKAL